MPVPPPPHPLPAMTTYELSRYRRDLEHALRSLPVGAPARQVLGQRLDGVLAEQQSRDDAVRDPGPGLPR